MSRAGLRLPAGRGDFACGHRDGSLIGAVWIGTDPSRSRALTQPCQDLETGIAVGGRNANFSLKIPHCTLGVAADTAVAAVGIETERGEAALDLLGDRRQKLDR